MSSTPKQPPTLLTLPPELRNAIYAYVFPPQTAHPIPNHHLPSPPLAKGLQLTDSHFHGSLKNQYTKTSSNASAKDRPTPTSTYLSPLLTARQIHHEAHLYALSHHIFHLSSSLALPDAFDLRSRPLSAPKLAALQHLTLTAKTSHLRALNETWAGLPFGHPCLKLETLTIVPLRPDASSTAWANVADLSQAHTLAYVFGETLKNLRNVRVLTVVNGGCFKEGVFELCYRSLVYRLFRWGGVCCGVRVGESGCADDRKEIGRGGGGDGGGEEDSEEFGGSAWFRVFLDQDDVRGREVGEEVCRLVGVEGLDPREAEAGAGAGM